MRRPLLRPPPHPRSWSGAVDPSQTWGSGEAGLASGRVPAGLLHPKSQPSTRWSERVQESRSDHPSLHLQLFCKGAVAQDAQGPSQGYRRPTPGRPTLTGPTGTGLGTANFPTSPPALSSPLGPEMCGAVPSETLIQLVLDARRTLNNSRARELPAFSTANYRRESLRMFCKRQRNC